MHNAMLSKTSGCDKLPGLLSYEIPYRSTWPLQGHENSTKTVGRKQILQLYADGHIKSQYTFD